MTLRISGGIVFLEGDCPIEEAEELLLALRADGSVVVDVGGAEHLHFAVVQILLAIRPRLRGKSCNAFLAEHVLKSIVEPRGEP